jgi:hypothetical protein
MALDWGHVAVEQLDWHWRTAARPRLEGLTDEEYLWEPAPECWSIRPRAEARSRMAAGKGNLVIDFEWPEPVPPPITTIAWRLGHVASGVFGIRASNHFGDGTMSYDTVEWPDTAAGGLAFLDETYASWMTGISAMNADDMDRECGPAEGPFSQAPFGALILHINREAIHHAAELALLRDLYRARP